jgi:hypothetical protein
VSRQKKKVDANSCMTRCRTGTGRRWCAKAHGLQF